MTDKEKEVVELITKMNEKSWNYIFRRGLILGFEKAVGIVKDAKDIDSAVFLLTGLVESLKCDLDNEITKKENQKDGEENEDY